MSSVVFGYLGPADGSTSAAITVHGPRNHSNLLGKI